MDLDQAAAEGGGDGFCRDYDPRHGEKREQRDGDEYRASERMLRCRGPCEGGVRPRSALSLALLVFGGAKLGLRRRQPAVRHVQLEAAVHTVNEW